MHIARAYCVEADRVVDIYQAWALFSHTTSHDGDFGSFVQTTRAVRRM
jgi:hypothetical protein